MLQLFTFSSGVVGFGPGVRAWGWLVGSNPVQVIGVVLQHPARSLFKIAFELVEGPNTRGQRRLNWRSRFASGNFCCKNMEILVLQILCLFKKAVDSKKLKLIVI